VYTGAIMVLFLFVIMLLNLNKATEPMKTLGTRVTAVVAGGLFFLTLLAALRHGLTIAPANAFDPGVGLVRSVGLSLFREFLLPFEISSVLFLSAMVGVVMLGKKEKASPLPLSPGSGPGQAREGNATNQHFSQAELGRREA
jgi:NADH-quinone oxidoreductase subunit J